MTSTTRDERLIPTPGEGPGGPDELGGEAPEGPRRPRVRGTTTLLVIVGALAVGAGAWYVNHVLSRPGSPSPAELPLLVGDTSPVKVRPESPGGADIPNRDKYVYKSLEGEPAEQPAEQLLPAPEEPLPKPVDNGPPIEPLANIPLDQMWSKPEAAAPPTQSLEKPPEKPGADASPLPTKQDVEIAAVAPANGGVWLQLGAVRDEAGAKAEWARLYKRFPDVLEKLDRRSIPADLGAKGIWLRLQVGPYADAAAADAACRTLAARGASCKIVKP